MAVTINNATIRSTNLPQWTPKQLFLGGEQGAWYDPSDTTTMFQDSAGTTPVTAVEQPVGLIQDKSGRGNNASQSTSASRPVLSARYNLLTKTEQFNDSVWTKFGTTATIPNNITAPDGKSTGNVLTENTANSFHNFFISTGLSLTTNYTCSIYLQSGTRQYVTFGTEESGNSAFLIINTSDFSYTTKTLGTGILSNPSVISVGNGWYRCSLTVLSAGRYFQLCGSNTSNPSVINPSYIGNGSTIICWGASLTVSNDGVYIPYQRVNTSTDYDSNSNLFPYYLKFDGTDDSLATSSIDFSGGDSISVSAGVRKLSDAALGVVAELSSTIASNNGTFLLSAPNSAAANYNYSSKGTSQSDNTITTYTSPISNVLVCNSVISTDTNNIYVNNGSATASATDQGSGNYGNYAMYLGRRGGSSSPFNGRLFNLIVRAGSLSATQAAQIATYLNGKDKIF